MMALPMRIADGDDDDDETREIFPIRFTWFPLEWRKNFGLPVTVNVGQS